MKKIKNKKYLIIGGGVLLLLIIITLASQGGQTIEFTTVSKLDVVQEINVTGKIAPEEKADLAFEKAGTVSYLAFKVGDKVKKGQVIGSLDSREALASYQSARANTLVEQAKLNDIRTGTRPEELSISESSYNNKVKSFQNTIRNTFVGINSTLRSTTDSFFENGNSNSPTINDTNRTSINNNNRVVELETLRVKITESIRKWDREYEGKNVSIESSADFARDTLTMTKSFIDKFITYIQNPNDSQRNILLIASENITDINKDFIADQAEYDNSQGDYALKKAGNTPNSVYSQQAKVEQARAQEMSEYAAYQKMTITAPFDGIVTLVKPVIGETVPANTTAFSVMMADAYKIEVFVPESNIAKLAIGNPGVVNLDAYGKDKFYATVTRIDPAETIVEGVPTYKVTLSIATDPRIKSGMTADINIKTAEKKNVLSVPTRAIFEKENKTYVRKMVGDDFVETPVEIGLKGSNGNTEILSGLNIGDNVRTN